MCVCGWQAQRLCWSWDKLHWICVMSNFSCNGKCSSTLLKSLVQCLINLRRVVKVKQMLSTIFVHLKTKPTLLIWCCFSFFVYVCALLLSHSVQPGEGCFCFFNSVHNLYLSLVWRTDPSRTWSRHLWLEVGSKVACRCTATFNKLNTKITKVSKSNIVGLKHITYMNCNIISETKR